MTKIAIILGSTRPGRNGEAVAKWVLDIAKQRSDAEFELVDMRTTTCRTSTRRCPPSMGQYSQPHTQELGGEDRARSTASSSSPPSTTTPPRAR